MKIRESFFINKNTVNIAKNLLGKVITVETNFCVNIVTEEEGYGGAVLLRSIIPLSGQDIMIKNRSWEGKDTKNLSNGPAKLCAYLGIGKDYDGLNTLEKDSKIYLEDISYITGEIKNSTRIGISKAKEKERRFYF